MRHDPGWDGRAPLRSRHAATVRRTSVQVALLSTTRTCPPSSMALDPGLSSSRRARTGTAAAHGPARAPWRGSHWTWARTLVSCLTGAAAAIVAAGPVRPPGRPRPRAGLSASIGSDRRGSGRESGRPQYGRRTTRRGQASSNVTDAATVNGSTRASSPTMVNALVATSSGVSWRAIPQVRPASAASTRRRWRHPGGSADRRRRWPAPSRAGWRLPRLPPRSGPDAR